MGLEIKVTEENNHKKNARIAKNTLLLYVRLLFTMGVGLFTSRVVLNSLGIADYGVYNIVGGVVAMFSLFTGSLSAAISRFLTFSLGKKDEKLLRRVFSTSVNIQLIMSIGIFAIGEVIAFLFLDYLNIPVNRISEAKVVFHFSLMTFCINLVSVPYNAAIIAHEKMSAFAYISILEVFLKLIVAYSLFVSPYDKLITYAILFAIVALIIRFVYGIYCRLHFAECTYGIIIDRSLLKEMSGFAGWNLLGTGAYLFNTQGVNIITNLFFGVTTNAARGVVNQVEGIVKQFVTNFTTAINPQITKSYAEGNLEYMYSLVCRGAKFSYILMLFFVVPFMFETETIMSVWLKNYPPEAPLFLRLSMIGTLFDLLGNSTANAAWATGNIKKYYIIIGGVGSLVFPVSWICFSLGMQAYTSYIVFIVVYCIVMILKVYIINGLISFPIKKFFSEVILRVVLVTIASFVFPMIIYLAMDRSLLKSFVIVIISLLSTFVFSALIGLTSDERDAVKNKILKKVKHVYC